MRVYITNVAVVSKYLRASSGAMKLLQDRVPLIPQLEVAS